MYSGCFSHRNLDKQSCVKPNLCAEYERTVAGTDFNDLKFIMLNNKPTP
jgi:hypothetical protein